MWIKLLNFQRTGDEDLSEDGNIDIVELSPETVDTISDEEEFDDNEIYNTQIFNVPGSVELNINKAINSESLSEPLPKQPKLSTKEIPKWNTKGKEPTCEIPAPWNTTPILEEMINEHEEKTPYEIFLLMTEGIFDMMAEQSQIYASQKNENNFICNSEDYKAFIGVLLLSGHRSHPRQESYWSQLL